MPADETFKAGCPECECNVFIPLMGVWVNRSFQGNRLRMEWPYRGENDQEYADVACPQCGAVLRVHADGKISPSGNRMFSGKSLKKTDGRKAARKV